MERFLCLDIGNKRIGVAVSDPFNTYALPIGTINRVNLATDLNKVGEYVKEKSVTALVCGLPVNFDGTPSEQTKRAQFFIDRLIEKFNLPVYTEDERCTTCEAEEVLISQGKTREERKLYVDGLAACSILEGYLNNYNKNKINGFKENNMENEEKKNCKCGHDHHEDHCDCGNDHHHDHCDCGDEHCDCGCEDEIVELTADDGRKLKFFFIGSIEYKGKAYSAFEPAEEIEGVSEDEMVIFELVEHEDGAELLPIEDDKLLDEVYEEFCRAIDEDEEQ